MTVLRASAVRPSPPARRIAFVAIGVAVAIALAVGLCGVLFLRAGALAAPYTPRVEDGYLTAPATLDDTDLPAIANLDAALLGALRDAAAAASSDGVSFEVTSGWRTARYQQWLLEDAVEDYGSVEVARQFVAAPDRSHHVTGHAVDIGPLDAQSWLIAHGAAWGLCQIYANERWHFELATDPGGTCPALRENAAG
ncbi:M15 family metallopeptidase [Microbacterium sp. AZCO]|uniref:M15 family metallopeptidase n=1 Tax=Microbacterium sp. AZCO TaxID=3142976 RepID=UPI0031F3D1BB